MGIFDFLDNVKYAVIDKKIDLELLLTPSSPSPNTTSSSTSVQENTGVVSAGIKTDSTHVSQPAAPEPVMVEKHSASIKQNAEQQEEPCKINVAEWLAMEMHHQMPDIPVQKIVEMVTEVISIITIDETKAESYVNARKNGISKASWREEQFDAALDKLGNEENKQQYRQHLEEILTRLKDKVAEL